MANQADFLVRNVFKEKRIKVERKPTTEKVDFEKELDSQEESVINVQSDEVMLVIYAPQGMDLKECSLKVNAAVDLEVIAYRSRSYWTVKIVPNELAAEVPTTVNINCGDTEDD